MKVFLNISSIIKKNLKTGYYSKYKRRGGRVVEGARLERVYASNRIEGSNPSLSAIRKKLF